MPIRKVKGGYKWGKKGKVYRSRKGAERQAAAAYASGYKKSMDWFETLKRDKEDMRVGTVYPSDREGKKIMMLTHEGKKIHAGGEYTIPDELATGSDLTVPERFALNVGEAPHLVYDR